MRSSRLFSRTLIFMVLIFGCIAVSNSAVSAWLMHRSLTREFSSKAFSIARSLAFSTPELFITRNAAAIQSSIDQYLDIEGVAYVLVTTEGGDILAHTFVPTIPEAVARTVRASGAGLRAAHAEFGEEGEGGSVGQVRTEGGGDYIHVAQPVLAGAGGYVHVGMDNELIATLIRQAVLRLQLVTLAVFAGSVILAWVFIRGIARPLEELTDYAQRVARHDYSRDITVSSRDEVGVLAQAMRTMSAEIAALIGSLEKRVADATAELSFTVDSMAAIMGNMADGLVVVDAKHRIVRHNEALARLLGAEGERLDGRDCEDVVGGGLCRLVFGHGEELMRQILAEHQVGPSEHVAQGASEVRTLEAELPRADGRVVPVEIAVSFVVLGEDPHAICIVRDITERKRSQAELRRAHDILEQRVQERTEELRLANAHLQQEVAERKQAEKAVRRAEEKYRSIFENATEGIFQSSPDGRYLSANPALARIYGYLSPEGLMAELTSIGDQLYVEPERRAEFVRLVEEVGEVVNFESQVRRKDGQVIWISENARKVSGDDGEAAYYEGSVEDITLRKMAEEQLVHQAFHDPLTQLPNRTLFHEQLAKALERSRRRDDYAFAVLYLDLDRFKIINDSLGHDTGDELLKHVAMKLLKCVRGMDTVARFGGDEFAILLEDMNQGREGIKIARRILEELAEPVMLKGHEVFTTSSIGIVLVYGAGRTDVEAHLAGDMRLEGQDGSDYHSPHDILRDADTAMYKAKEGGKNRFRVFNKRMHDEALRLMALETDLRRAVDKDEFEVHYQPIVHLPGGELAGFEALVRWRHPRYGLVPPSEFIPLAEDTGLIFPLGWHVLGQVCALGHRWAAEHPEALAAVPGFFLSVNISGKQFMHNTLIQQMEDFIQRADMDPRMLKLEITESVLMENAEAAVGMLARVRKAGVRVCIDDFGTGYSSLSYLQRLPIDTLKVDRSFVIAAGKDPDSLAIVRTIVSLGHSLGIGVVAEGVETDQHRSLLVDARCPLAQGYLFSKPLTAEDATAMVRAIHDKPPA